MRSFTVTVLPRRKPSIVGGELGHPGITGRGREVKGRAGRGWGVGVQRLALLSLQDPARRPWGPRQK